MNKKYSAVVLATGLNGLGAVRSLHKAGFYIVSLVSSKGELAALSKLSDQLHFVVTDDRWEENTLSLLLRLEHDSRPPVVACSDRAADFLAAHVDQLQEKYSLLIPSPLVTASLNDKRLEIMTMDGSGVPLPNSLANFAEGISNGKLLALNYPIIIKPRTFDDYKLIQAKNIIIKDRHEWDEFYQRFSTILDRLVAQEVIAGGDDKLWVCNVTFDRNSELIAAFSFQRLGTMPSHYGVTSMAVSRYNPDVIELCKKIGAVLDYVGPAMIEFKYDVLRGEYIYIETNPRLGMCNWFDTCCGVNNVEISCLAAMEERLPVRNVQVSNMLFWNFYGDLIARFENKESVGSILQLYLRNVPKKKVWAVYVSHDVNPFFVNMKQQSYNFLSRVLKKLK